MTFQIGTKIGVLEWPCTA